MKIISQEQADEIYRRLPKMHKLIFALGLETGLRISDILRLKVQDVENPLQVYVSRTKTVCAYPISQWLLDELYAYAEERPPDNFVFYSPRRRKRRPIHRVTYHRALKQAADGLPFSCSAHSTRKHYLEIGDGEVVCNSTKSVFIKNQFRIKH